MHRGALDNAGWCDLVCTAHGAPTRFDDDAWVSLRRSPPWYPDAVTLRPGVREQDLLAHVDASAGCSVKDSFADLDLTGAGFQVLLEAQWVARAPGPAPFTSGGPEWREVTTSAGMHAWTAMHGSGETLRPVLGHCRVTVLGAYDGDALVGGVIAHRSDDVVGVSNAFGADLHRLWPGVVAAVAARHPGVPLVGYEDGESLEAARAAGFEVDGRLRVWLKE